MKFSPRLWLVRTGNFLLVVAIVLFVIAFVGLPSVDLVSASKTTADALQGSRYFTLEPSVLAGLEIFAVAGFCPPDGAGCLGWMKWIPFFPQWSTK